MSCAYIFNVSDQTDPHPNHTYFPPSDVDRLLRLRHYVNDVITPTVFLFGIIGNVITFVVLSSRRLYPERRQTMLERSALFGLRTLTLSDFLFCTFGFPGPFLRGYTANASTDGGWVMLSAYYLAHRGAFLNLFLFTSTWLIVLISVERYLVVCHPFRSVGLIHIRNTFIAYVTVFVVSVLVNLPLFVKFSIIRVPCTEGCACYYPQPSYYFSNPVFIHAHKVVWSAIGTFIPLGLILVSNAFLVRELVDCADSRANEHRPSLSGSEQFVTLRLTVTLTAIVVCFLVMVCPSMILQLIRFEDYHGIVSVAASSSSSSSSLQSYSRVSFQIAISMTNLTQALKFSSNFLLYCAFNKSFRRTLTGLVRCNGCRKDSASIEYEMGAML